MVDRIIGVVGTNTRATEVISNLRRSAEGERVDDLKVKGRRLKDGSIELYWSTKKSSLWDQLSGRAAKRRELARRAFEQLCKTEMDHLEKDQCFTQAHHREAVSVLLNSAGFDRVPRGEVYKLNKHANRHALKSFRLHAQLLELEGLCRDARRERTRSERALAFCDSLAKVKETKDGQPVLDGLTHDRKLGGEGAFGEGAFGDIHVYRDKQGREYAVKVIRPKDDADAAQAKLDFMHECDALTAAGTSGAREIVKLVKPPLRTDNGSFVLVMEFAPYGDLHNFIHETLKKAKEAGLDDLHLNRVRGMIFRDILQGLHAAHQAGLIHGDLKPPNIVIGSGGVAKITDFGTAQIGKRFAPALSPPVDNALWLSPEILVMQNEAKEHDADLLESMKINWKDFYREQLGLGEKGAVILLQGLTSNLRHQEAAAKTVGRKSDLWALGVIAFNLAYGKEFDEGGKLARWQVQDKIGAFKRGQIAVGQTYDDGTFEPGYFMAEDGGVFGGTVNRLLAANPQERDSLENLLNEWPSEEELGGQATRHLIVRLANGTWKPGEEFDETEYVVSDEESSNPD